MKSMTLNFVIGIFAHIVCLSLLGFNLWIMWVMLMMNILLHKYSFLIQFLSQYKLNFLIIFVSYWLTTTQLRCVFKLKVIQFYKMYKNVKALLLRLFYEYMKLKAFCVHLVRISLQFWKKNHLLFDGMAINESCEEREMWWLRLTFVIHVVV